MFGRKQFVENILDRQYAAAAVVTVGSGRGFRLFPSFIATAATCLPSYPPFDKLQHMEAYSGLIGPLGESPSIDARCCFADPVSNIAVLEGIPSRDEPGRGAFERFVHWENSVTIKRPRQTQPGVEGYSDAVILSPKGWLDCSVGHIGSSLWFEDQADWQWDPSFSGSPIFHREGGVIGMLNVSSPHTSPDEFYANHLVIAQVLPFRFTSNNEAVRASREAEGKTSN